MISSLDLRFGMNTGALGKLIDMQESLSRHVAPFRQATEILDRLQPWTRHFTDVSGASLPFHESMLTAVGPIFPLVNELNRLLPQTATLPGVEWSRLAESIRQLTPVSSFGASHQMTEFVAYTQELSRSIECPITALVNRQGFIGLAALTHSLNLEPPFSAPFELDLRDSLGDWREITVREDRCEVTSERVQAYRDLGLDPDLTDVNDSIFFQVLRKAADSSLESQYLTHTSYVLHTPATSAGAFDLIFSVEVNLRNLIDSCLRRVRGANWYQTAIPGEMLTDWKRKLEEDVQRGKKPSRLVDYADFTDYIKIISKKDNWRDVFQAVFKRRESIQESLHRLQPIRVTTMHSREITKQDILLLYVEYHRILKAIANALRRN